MALFDISLAVANKLYLWGWRGSLAGAILTALSLIILMWGTRVRDHDAEQQLAKLNYEAAESREKASRLEKEAAEAALETERLKEQLSWRRLSDSQAKTIADNVRGQSLNLGLSALANDPESMLFATDIQKALKSAGFNLSIKSQVIFGGGPIVGLIISGPRLDVEKVAKGFVLAGINVIGKERQGDVEILVGSKPPPN